MRRRALDVAARARVACSSTLARAGTARARRTAARAGDGLRTRDTDENLRRRRTGVDASRGERREGVSIGGVSARDGDGGVGGGGARGRLDARGLGRSNARATDDETDDDDGDARCRWPTTRTMDFLRSNVVPVETSASARNSS